MGVKVTFNYGTWAQTYPELAPWVDEPTAQAYFDMAGSLYLRNDGSGPVKQESVQSMLLNLLVSHLAKLMSPIGGQASSDIVGRISSAGEGSVNVQTENLSPNMSAEWFRQTKYGYQFWQATAAYRTFRFRPAPRNGGVVGPTGFGI